MNKLKALVFTMGLFVQLAVTAQPVADSALGDAIDGIWEGMIVLDANTSMNLKFTSNIEGDGNRVVRLSSPDNAALTNMRASSVDIEEGKVTLEFPGLNSRFEGLLENQSLLTGEWQMSGTAFPITLSKLVTTTISAADIAMIVGDWSGILTASFGDNPIDLRFEATEDGSSLRGFGLGSDGTPNDPPLSEITLVDSKLRFIFFGLIYEGSFVSDTEIEGEVTLRNGDVVTLNLSKN